MRVLWFVNKPLPAVTRRLRSGDYHIGGWLDGLEMALRPHVDLELGVAAVAPRVHQPFEDHGVVYYSLGAGESTAGIGRVATRWRQVVSSQADFADCLAVIDHFRPDVVHIHGTESAYGLLCDRISVPSVISIQGLLTVIARMDARGVDSSLVRSLSPGLFLRGGGLLHAHLRTRREAKRERQIISICRNFIGRTRFDEDFVRTINPTCRYFPEDHRILRPEFESAAWSLDSTRGPIVYSTSGSYARKGVSTLLEAVALLRRSSEPRIQVRIGGSLGSPEEELRAVHRRIRRLGIEEHVLLLGDLPPGAVAAELCAARAFVLSSHVDNSPNSLAEAMYVGVPCVASSVGGVPSMARNEIEALLVQDGDPYALAGALSRLFRDDSLAVALGACARQTARLRHDPVQIGNRMLAIYRDLAGDGQAMSTGPALPT